MSREARRISVRKVGLSVSLAAAVALGTATGMAQPASATAQDATEEQAATEEHFTEGEQDTPTADGAEHTIAEDAPEQSQETPEQDLEETEEQDAEEVVPESEDPEQAETSQEPNPPADAEQSPTDLTLHPAATEGSSYDPRKTEGTSAVRDQFWGTCWAQSGISSMESFLIHSGMASTDVKLSVEDVLWWVHE